MAHDLPANLEVKMQAVDYDKAKELDRLVELCELRNKLCALLTYFHSSVIMLFNDSPKKRSVQMSEVFRGFFF